MAASTEHITLEPIIRKFIVKVFFRNAPNSFWSGFVVGNVRNDCIILTTAHCVRDTQVDSENLFGVSFYDPNSPSSKLYEAITRFLKQKSEILILSVQFEHKSTIPKLVFATEEEWSIRPLDTVFAVSHPTHRPWRASFGRACSSTYFF